MGEIELYSPRREEQLVYGDSLAPSEYESGSSGGYGGMLGSGSNSPRHQQGSVGSFGSHGNDVAPTHHQHDIFSLFGASAGNS